MISGLNSFIFFQKTRLMNNLLVGNAFVQKASMSLVNLFVWLNPNTVSVFDNSFIRLNTNIFTPSSKGLRIASETMHTLRLMAIS